MITVQRNGLSIKITGHAESAEAGKDLICASASILFYTLVENIEEHSKIGDCKSQVKALEGDAEVKVVALPSHQEEIANVFNTIMVGYEILSQDYPEYIRIVP